MGVVVDGSKFVAGQSLASMGRVLVCREGMGAGWRGRETGTKARSAGELWRKKK